MYIKKKYAIKFLHTSSNNMGTYALIQSEKATCSSCLTECVVPSLEASDMPPKVSKFSRLETAVLKTLVTSFDFSSLYI